MSRGQWEDDDDLYGEGSDLGDDDEIGDEEDLEDEAEASPPTPPPPPPPSSFHSGPQPVRTAEQRPRVVLNTPTNGAKSPVSKPRRLKVKPMNAAMRTKWPDVTSVLLTLGSGHQLMFVRG